MTKQILAFLFCFTRELNLYTPLISVLTKGHQNAAACSFAARLARSGLYQWGDGTPAGLQTRSAPGQDTRSGQGALARRHTDDT